MAERVVARMTPTWRPRSDDESDDSAEAESADDDEVEDTVDTDD